MVADWIYVSNNAVPPVFAVSCATVDTADDSGADQQDQTDANTANATGAVAVKAKAKRARARRYQRSARGKVILLSTVAALFVVTTGYFVMSYLLSDRHLSSSTKLLPESVYAFRRLNRVRTLLSGIMRLVVSPVLLTTEFRPFYPEILASQVQADLQDLNRLQQGLLYGDPEWDLSGSIRRNKMRDDLEFGNACAYLDESGMDSMDEVDIGSMTCEGFMNGLFLRGLSAGMSFFVDSAAQTLTQLTALPAEQLTNITRIRNFLTSPEWSTLELMDRNILRYGLVLESRTYVADLVDMNAAFVTMRAGLLAGFLVALAVAYWLVYEPMIRSLDLQLKQARSLLVMIPPDLVQGSLAMRKIIMNT